jgi:hypothetical protein
MSAMIEPPRADTESQELSNVVDQDTAAPGPAVTASFGRTAFVILITGALGFSFAWPSVFLQSAEPNGPQLGTPPLPGSLPRLPRVPGAKTELKPAGFATIKGKVTYEGIPPQSAEINIADANIDKNFCLKGAHKDETWVIGPAKGVANVVVWVRPPKDKFFVVPVNQRNPQQKVVKIDQPFCAFEPHVSVTFPSFYDPSGKKQQPTGQSFEVTNSAPIVHNTNWNPRSPLVNVGGNMMIMPRKKLKISLNAAPPRKTEGEDLILRKCNIHTWMRAYVWSFSHPWAAVTKADGTYEIKNVPAGSELFLVAWHEPMTFLLPNRKGSPEGMRIKRLKNGETRVQDFTAEE